jgi:surface polysaccharide O-acyltransferase-like enzyme
MNRQYAALSGIAIFLIVLNHAIHFGLQVAPVDGAWHGGMILLQAFGAFAVPAFLFVSGAFLAYSARQLTFTFVRNSLSRILWPYAIWSAVFYVSFVRPGATLQALGAYVWNLLIGFPYHFVPLLVLCYLAAPLLVRVGRRWPVALIGVIGIYQALLLGLRFSGHFGLSPEARGMLTLVRPPVLFDPLAQWALYFPLGLVIALHDKAIRPRLLRLRDVLTAATAVLFAAGMATALGLASVPWARFLAPVPMMLLLPVVSRASIPLVDRFEELGRRSYGIYLVHFVVINALVALASVSPPALRLPALVFPAFLALTLALTLLVMHGMERSALTRRIYRHLFGIVPATSKRPGGFRQPPTTGNIRTDIATA